MKTGDVKYSCLLAILIFIIVLLSKGNFELSVIWSSITTAVSLTILLRLIFLKWVWKWLPFLERVHGVPNVEGAWSGNFTSTWQATPQSPFATGTIEVKIKQPDLYTLKVTQRSGESTSHSFGESFETLADGSVMVNFSYRNDPKATVRDRSQISYGAARYELIESNKYKELSGDYFTDRKTTGTIRLKLTAKK